MRSSSKTNQAPSQEQVSLGGQAPVNASIMSYGKIIEAFVKFTNVMATNAQVVTTPAQAMMSLENREVSTSLNQNASTMASHLR